jgi:hypothetical protein
MHAPPPARPPTPAERSLLLATAGLAPGWGGPTGPLDWDFLVPYARRHLLLPALGSAALRSDPAFALLGIPPDARGAMRDAAIHNEMQNHVLLVDLAEAVCALDQAGIGSIALKGAGLIARFADLLRTRHTDDIDLWVEPGCVFEADRILRARGYGDLVHASEPVPRYDGSARSAPLRQEAHQLPVLVSVRGTPLEIHRRPPAAPIATAARWAQALARAEHVIVHGVRVRIRDAGSMLLDLCTHVVVHHGAKPCLWPRHLLDVETLLGGHQHLFAEAAAAARIADRIALGVTSAVRGQVLSSASEPLARRLVLPLKSFVGWGWYSLAEQILGYAARGPGSLARALWPSTSFLRARGFDPDRGRLRAHLARARDVVARAGAR